MGKRTTLLKVSPWQGGIRTSTDPAMIRADQLVEGDNIIFSEDLSKKKREGINFDWDDATDGSATIISLHDFRFGDITRSRRLVGVTNTGEIYSYTSSGTRSADLFGGTAWSSLPSKGTQVTINNLDIIAVDGTGNVVKKWDGTGSVADLGGTPPEGSIVTTHLARLWMNDKTDIDRLHYSPTSDPETWNGLGDSGAIDIGIGDGDTDGITAFAPYKGDLIVFKRNRIYRVIGNTPETFQIVKISDSIGCVGPNALADIDGNDLVFISDRGIHSIAATDTFGDFKQNFLSADIQTSFNDDWSKTRRPFIQARYLPNQNVVALAVTDESINSTTNLMMWFYHIEARAWFRWPDVSCEALAVVEDDDQSRLYLGTDVTRVAQTFNGANFDVDGTGVSVGIDYTIKTGLISPTGVACEEVGFKSFGILYRAIGTHTITATIKIDNYDPQTLTYSQTDPSDLLGVDFILGQSVLGTDNVMAPYKRTIDGYGRYIQITISQTGIEEEIDLQGFFIEYESAGIRDEVINAADLEAAEG